MNQRRDGRLVRRRIDLKETGPSLEHTELESRIDDWQTAAQANKFPSDKIHQRRHFDLTGSRSSTNRPVHSFGSNPRISKIASKSSLLRRWPKRVFNHISDSARQFFSRAGVIERTIWEDTSAHSPSSSSYRSLPRMLSTWGSSMPKRLEMSRRPLGRLTGTGITSSAKSSSSGISTPIPAETDKRALRDIIWVREADMQALSLEDPIAHQDKLPVMWHRRIQPRHRVTSFFGRRKLIDIDNCRHLNAPIRKQLESGATPFPGSRSANPHSCAPRHNARPRPRTH